MRVVICKPNSIDELKHRSSINHKTDGSVDNIFITRVQKKKVMLKKSSINNYKVLIFFA